MLPIPKPPPAGSILTEQESIEAERRATLASSILDFRDVPGKESPLGLAVRLGDPVAVEMLMRAGAEVSLQNAAGWTPLQEAICARDEALTAIILRHYQVLAWGKYMRRLPSLAAIMRRMRDFYMELTWNFESSVIPFITRIAPSDTYRIWKRGSCLRADMTLAGFDGLRIKRKNQSLMFFGDGTPDQKVKAGTLIILNHEKKESFDALEGAGGQPSEAELAQDVQSFFQTNVYRAGVDVSAARVRPQGSWRGGTRTEVINGYKSKVHEMHNVTFRFKSRKVPGVLTDEELLGEAGREKTRKKGKGEGAGGGAEGGSRPSSGAQAPRTPLHSSAGAEGSGLREHVNGDADEDDEGSVLDLDDLLTEEERRQLDAALAAQEADEDEHADGRTNGDWAEHTDDDVSEEMSRLSVNGEGASGAGPSGGTADQTKKSRGVGRWTRWRRSGEKSAKTGSEGEDGEAASAEGRPGGDAGRHGRQSKRRSREEQRGGSRKASVDGEQGEAPEKQHKQSSKGQATNGEDIGGKAGHNHKDSGKDEEDDDESVREGWQRYEEKGENELRRGLRPMLWLTEDFPLDMKELMPLLDLLANKVKAVQRVKELLVTKLPPDTVPVKVAIPVIPTIRVSVTFSKFEEHVAPKADEGEDDDEFHTPPGSPEREDVKKAGWLAWVRGKHKRSAPGTEDDADPLDRDTTKEELDYWAKDPFQIPQDYKWLDLAERKRRDREKRKKAKAKARAKKEGAKTSPNAASGSSPPAKPGQQ